MFKLYVDGFLDFIKASAIAWIILLAVALLLALPGQIHEYYRVAAIQLSVDTWSDYAVWICFFAVVMGLLGYVCVVGLNLCHQHDKDLSSTPTPQRRTAEFIAASIAFLLPFAGLVVGLIKADVGQQPTADDANAVQLIGKAYQESYFDFIGTETSESRYTSLIGSEISFWLYVSAAIVAVIGNVLIVAIRFGPLGRSLRSMAGHFANHSGRAFLLFMAIFAVCSIALACFNWLHYLSENLGTFGFLTLGLGLVLLIITSLACYSRKVQFPFCFLFLVWPIALAFLGWNDNDELLEWNAKSKVSSSERSSNKLPDQFSGYFNSRMDALREGEQTDVQKDVPVYIVAAPGGGFYASYFASTVLTHAAEKVPNFRKHLLAISSVSGGSLGAALFTSLYFDNKSCEAGYISPNASTQPRSAPAQLRRMQFLRSFHENDFLAPIVGSLLFLDSVQAYVPVKIPIPDRARAFEASILSAWAQAKTDAQELTSVIIENGLTLPENLNNKTSHPLDCPLGKVFESSSQAPAILFNVTEVRSGRQRVLAPFVIDGGFKPSATKDVKLVTAAALSARFAYVTPPGWFPGPNGLDSERIYLVDGGYYENSGVATAQALVSKLEDLRNNNPNKKFKLRLIVLVGPQGDGASTDSNLSELLSPVRALGRSRSARGHNYVEQLRNSLDQCGSAEAKPSDDCQMVLSMKNLLYPLPLGWDMSELSRFVIEAQRGKFGKCNKDNDKGSVNAKCFIEFLEQDLK